MILASGAFDGLHAGHVRYLQAVANLGRPLIVAVAPDSYITNAKQRKPYWTQRERAQVVSALACVTSVYGQGSTSVAEAIRELRPTVFVKGMDWQGKLPEDVKAACVDVGARVVFTATEATHTSEARR